MQRKSTILAGIGIAAVVAAGGSAFTASNTVTNAFNTGQGEATVAGYNTTAVSYSYTGTNKDQVSGVTMTVTPVSGATPAAVVKARLAAGDEYTQCSQPDAEALPLKWSCTFATAKAVSAVTTLDVYATSDSAAGSDA